MAGKADKTLSKEPLPEQNEPENTSPSLKETSVQAPPQPPLSPPSSPPKEQNEKQNENQKPPPSTATDPNSQSGVFSAWGFDVNAVAGNIGGFFTAADPTAPDVITNHIDDPADDMGSTAANIANVATAELEQASKAAQQTIGKVGEELGKVGEELGKGWGTLNTFLDNMLDAKPGDKAELDDDADVHNKFHSLFPELEKDDEVVDHFKCTLLQKYRCFLNNATPEKTYPLQGRLFVSTLHIAMYIVDDRGAFGGQPFGISVPFADVAKIQKGAKSMLRLVTKSQSSLIFSDFESDSHFTGALSLLEHMAASAASPSPEKGVKPDEEKEAPSTG